MRAKRRTPPVADVLAQSIVQKPHATQPKHPIRAQTQPSPTTLHKPTPAGTDSDLNPQPLTNPPPPVSQEEVEALYRRFRSLDRGLKGYISSEELLGIPELSINPLAQRVLRL